MKKRTFLTFLSLSAAATTVHAANVSVQTNPNQVTVSYSKVFIDIRDAGTSLRAGGVYIYHAPKAKLPNGQLDSILISSLNGTEFCRALGHAARNTEGDGGEIACGEDESKYAAYNFYTRRWESEGTGSANRCYPLYKTIECK